MAFKNRLALGVLMSVGTVSSFAATPVGGLYGEAFGGVAGVSSYIAKNSFNDANFKSGYNVGGLVGIKTGPFHYNIEGLYIYSTPRDYTFNSVKQTASGDKSSAILGFVNIGYDFKDIMDNISPFIDVGIGFNYLSTQLTSISPSQTRYSNNFYDFSYQGKIGTTFNFSENYAITTSYRYVRGASTDDNGKVYQAHLGQMGVIYRFEHL